MSVQLIILFMILIFSNLTAKEIILFKQDEIDVNAIVHLKHCILSLHDYKVDKDFDTTFAIWFHLNKLNNLKKVCNLKDKYDVNLCKVQGKLNELPLNNYINKILNNSELIIKYSKNNTHSDLLNNDGNENFTIFIIVIIKIVIILLSIFTYIYIKIKGYCKRNNTKNINLIERNLLIK